MARIARLHEYKMSNCVWLLLNAHNEGTMVLLILQIVTAAVCLTLSTIVAIRSSVTKQTTQSRSPQHQTHCTWLFVFKIFKIVTPAMFAITATLQLLNGLIDSHHENALNDGWVPYIQHVCGFKLSLINPIVSICNIGAIELSFYTLASFYFSRLVIIFEDSAFAITRQTKIVAVTTMIVLLGGIVASILLSLLVSKLILALSMVCLFLSFACFTVYFQKFLTKQLHKILSSGRDLNCTAHSQNIFSTLIRLEVLFIISIVSSTINITVYTTFVATGLYVDYVETRGVANLVAQLDMLINIICIGMQFPFVDHLYKRIFTTWHTKLQQKYQHEFEAVGADSVKIQITDL